MSRITDTRLRDLLAPYLEGPLKPRIGLASTQPPAHIGTAARDHLHASLQRYLDMLMKWNARTNLTAVREPELIVTRHFGESLFAARCIEAFTKAESVLDFGSGAGFPGIPIQLYLPELVVTLAESQGKKAAFLREAVRELGIGAQVWGERVSEMASGESFDLVSVRAVDVPERARAEAWERVVSGGWLLEMSTTAELQTGLPSDTVIPIPDTRDGVVSMTKRLT